MIGCDCPVCTSADPRDKRTRPSVVFKFGDRAILVDTSPELRLQCIANGINRIDALLYTHAHADHVAGMDDLRRFNWLGRSEVHAYGTAETLGTIQRMFAYIFEDEPAYPSYKPSVAMHTIDDAPFELFGQRVTPIPLLHGQLPVLGYRIGGIAYCTDCGFIPDSSLERLRGLDVLILDALRKRPHPTHFNLEQAIEVAGRIGAKHTYFTHIAHELGHVETTADLPERMSLAYDGLVVESAGCGAIARE
jgi:phosphoribosyl 1,2-cyclic phosphate phosphodiesterase